MCYYSQKHLPLSQGTTQSVVRKTSLPIHPAPPFIGGGLSHVRDRIRPRAIVDWPPHRQSVHELQALQPPSADGKYKTKTHHTYGVSIFFRYFHSRTHTRNPKGLQTVNCQCHRRCCLISGNILGNTCEVGGILLVVNIRERVYGRDGGCRLISVNVSDNVARHRFSHSLP